MKEYKVRFYISYKWISPTGKSEIYNGKLHYVGDTLNEAVDKAIGFIRAYEKRNQGYCTSMLIQRGRERGRNIKWKDYVKERRKTNKNWAR